MAASGLLAWVGVLKLLIIKCSYNTGNRRNLKSILTKSAVHDSDLVDATDKRVLVHILADLLNEQRRLVGILSGNDDRIQIHQINGVDKCAAQEL